MFCVFSIVTVGTMLSRGARTGGYDLPGAESTAVPLIGYRPLSHDSSSPGDPLGRDSSNNKVKTTQVNHPVVTWAMRRYNIYCVPSLFVLIWVWFCFPCVVSSSFCFVISPLTGWLLSFTNCWHLSSLTCVWSCTSVNPVKGHLFLLFNCFLLVGCMYFEFRLSYQFRLKHCSYSHFSHVRDGDSKGTLKSLHKINDDNHAFVSVTVGSH